MAKAGVPSGKCTVCAHAERGRIDYLAATGQALSPLAERFGLKRNAVERHYANHVTDDFKRAVKVGPFESEDHLRKLLADGNASVLEHFQGLRALLTARLMLAYDAGADATIISITGQLRSIGMDIARLCREITPPPSVTVNAFVLGEDFRTAMLDLMVRRPDVAGELTNIVRMVADRETKLLNVTPVPELAHVG